METRIGTVTQSRATDATVRVESGAIRVGDQLHVLHEGEEAWAEVLGLGIGDLEVTKAASGETVHATLDRPVPSGAEVYKLDAIEAHEGDDDLRLAMPPGGPDDPVPDQAPVE